VTLSAAKLRLIVNQLADPGTGHAAAHILATEAKARGVLVSDLIASTLVPTAPPTPPSSSPPEPRAASTDSISNRRYKYDHTVVPIDLGLRLADVEAEALAFEPTTLGKSGEEDRPD
jgi:hypothetical protein